MTEFRALLATIDAELIPFYDKVSCHRASAHLGHHLARRLDAAALGTALFHGGEAWGRRLKTSAAHGSLGFGLFVGHSVADLGEFGFSHFGGVFMVVRKDFPLFSKKMPGGR